MSVGASGYVCFKLWLGLFVFLFLTGNIGCLDAGSICKTPNGEKGNCISLYECDAILDAISTKTPEALKFSKQSHCGCDEGEPLVCCGTQSNFSPTLSTELPQTQTQTIPIQQNPTTESIIVTSTELLTESALPVTEEEEPNQLSESEESTMPCESICGCHMTDELFSARCLDAGSICTTPNGEIANCISLYECNVILDAIALRTNEALNFSKQSHCGCDDSEPLVCCGSFTSYVDLPTTTEEPNMPTSTVSSSSTENIIVTTDTSTTMQPVTFIEHIANYSYLLPGNETCGFRGPNVEDTKRLKDEYPWLAVIYSDATNRPVCFGSLINDRYVLTSASCLMFNPKYPRRITRVRLGEYDVSRNGVDCAIDPDFEECSEPAVDYKVNELILHENFNREKGYSNDIGLIRLATKVRYTDYTRPICLPDASTNLAAIGDVIYATSWDYLRKQGQIARMKKKAILKIIDKEECKLRAGDPGDYYMPNTMMCTKYTVKGPCLGDTGIPIMFRNNLQWHQEGIISYARDEGFCEADNIVLSTRVIDYIDWIVSKLKP